MLHINYQHGCTFSIIMYALQLAHDKDFSFLTEQIVLWAEGNIYIGTSRKKKEPEYAAFCSFNIFHVAFVCFCFCSRRPATCLLWGTPVVFSVPLVGCRVLPWLHGRGLPCIAYATGRGDHEDVALRRLQEKDAMFLQQAIDVLNGESVVPLSWLFRVWRGGSWLTGEAQQPELALLVHVLRWLGRASQPLALWRAAPCGVPRSLQCAPLPAASCWCGCIFCCFVSESVKT